MATEREALNALAAACGYGLPQLSLIAQATMPSYEPGAALTDSQLGYLTQAAEVCRESGLRDSEVADAVEQHRARSGAAWREGFWRERLKIAAAREALPKAARPQAPALDANAAAEAGGGTPATKAPERARAVRAAAPRPVPLALDEPDESSAARVGPRAIPPAAPEGAVAPVAAIPPQAPRDQPELDERPLAA